MKKILSLVLALALLSSLCVSAFAGELYASGSESGTVSVTVKTESTDPEFPGLVDPEHMYHVSLTWDSLNFVYSGNVTWDPANLEYVGGTWDQENGDIVVTNRSNASVSVATGIDVAEKNGVTATITNGNFDLGSAEGGVVTSNAIDITVAGNPTAAQFDIGTVTVTITTH